MGSLIYDSTSKVSLLSSSDSESNDENNTIKDRINKKNAFKKPTTKFINPAEYMEKELYSKLKQDFETIP
jgi:hypothetical protein